MTRNSILAVTTALCLFVQLESVSSVRAEEVDSPTKVSAGVFSAIATVIGLPLKVATCGATVAIGGVGYGLTLGDSDFVQQELLAGTPYACGARLSTIPSEVLPLVSGPQPREMQW